MPFIKVTNQDHLNFLQKEIEANKIRDKLAKNNQATLLVNQLNLQQELSKNERFNKGFNESFFSQLTPLIKENEEKIINGLDEVPKKIADQRLKALLNETKTNADNIRYYAGKISLKKLKEYLNLIQDKIEEYKLDNKVVPKNLDKKQRILNSVIKGETKDDNYIKFTPKKNKPKEVNDKEILGNGIKMNNINSVQHLFPSNRLLLKAINGDKKANKKCLKCLLRKSPNLGMRTIATSKVIRQLLHNHYGGKGMKNFVNRNGGISYSDAYKNLYNKLPKPSNSIQVYGNPEEVAKRVKVLLAEYEAGNKSSTLRNQIIEHLNYLHNSGKISGKDVEDLINQLE